MAMRTIAWLLWAMMLATATAVSTAQDIVPLLDRGVEATSLHDSVSGLLLKWYAQDVDPRVHGAVAWVLGR